jgi:oligopeptide transport system substrate-binding protein
MALAAVALLAAACTAGERPDGERPDPAADGYSVSIGDVRHPLVPGATTDAEGAQVLRALWTGLVQYDEALEVAYTGVAESITSPDSRTWTVRLHPGWTFHDGTPVTAASFVDAWNYTAYSPNRQAGGLYLQDIEGWSLLQADEDSPDPPPERELAGLRVVDDLTFEVRLEAPSAQFPLMLGYNAFFPLPQAFLDAATAAGEGSAPASPGWDGVPIGNGPFRAATPFVPGEGITLARYEEYAGPEPAAAESVELRVYASLDTAYLDTEAGVLDVAAVPASALGSAEEEFGPRYLQRASSALYYLVFPTYDERFSDPRVRQAFSLALDRDAMSEAVFAGQRRPARSLVSPVVPGHRPDACGYCEHDPERARDLLAETGFDRSEPVELWFPAGTGEEEWMEAVGNGLRSVLGLEYELRSGLGFVEYLALQDARRMTGPFRQSWVMDYPSARNYLEPQFTTGAFVPGGSNASFYSDPRVDELVAAGAHAQDDEQAVSLFQQAEDILLEDLPALPMFYGTSAAVHTEAVTDVVVDGFGLVDLTAVTVVR